jgi:Tfp pilus assembly protein PilN
MSRTQELHGFLPDDYVELKAQRRTNLLWAMVFLVVAGGIGWAYVIAQNKIHRAEDENRAVTEEYAAAAKPIDQFRKLQDEQRKLNRQAELAHSLVEKVNRSNVLAELANCLPARVYLSDMNLDAKKQGAAAKAAAPQRGVSLPEPIQYDVTVRIVGLAQTDRLVVDYVNNLVKSPLFANVEILNTSATVYKDQKMRAFQVEMTLNPDADTRTASSMPSAKVE